MGESFALTAPASPDRGWAEFSTCKRYRYALGRAWGHGAPSALFCMLNPSRAGADPVDNDLTVTKCCGFARRWNMGGVVIVNLYQWIETYSPRLFDAMDPAGPNWLNRISHYAHKHPQRVVCAWGSQGPRADSQASLVVERLRAERIKLWCLGLTKGGCPRHPSRLGYDTALEPYGGVRG